MTLNKALSECDTEIKIEGAKRAVQRFTSDSTQSEYSKVYMEAIWDVVESIVGDYERRMDWINKSKYSLHESSYSPNGKKHNPNDN